MDSLSGRHGAVTTAHPGDAVAAVQRNAEKAVEDCGLGNHKKLSKTTGWFTRLPQCGKKPLSCRRWLLSASVLASAGGSPILTTLRVTDAEKLLYVVLFF